MAPSTPPTACQSIYMTNDKNLLPDANVRLSLPLFNFPEPHAHRTNPRQKTEAQSMLLLKTSVNRAKLVADLLLKLLPKSNVPFYVCTSLPESERRTRSRESRRLRFDTRTRLVGWPWPVVDGHISARGGGGHAGFGLLCSWLPLQWGKTDLT